MKRRLFLLIVSALVSIGTWAAPGDPYEVKYDEGTSAGTETVVKIMLRQAGSLATAIAEAKNSGNSFQYLLLETDKQSGTITLTSEDITALNGLNVSTINLTKADLADYAFSNSYVSYIILPYDLTKEQVKTLGVAYKNNTAFKVCFSTSDTKAGANTGEGGDATLIAYIDEAGSLADGIKRTYFLKVDPHGNANSEDPATLGNKVYQGGGDCTRLRYLHVMGNFCAKDISSQGNYDENGHYVINGVADENAPLATGANKNTEGGNLYSGGSMPGALKNCQQLYVIDLKDGYVPDEYATDIVVGYNGTQATNLREVWMPEDPRFKTVPADYLNVNSEKIRQICIPGNIEYIKTRAFAGSGTSINYIWTTGPEGNTKYDNGAYFVSGDNVTLKYKVNPDPTDPENIDFADGDDNNCTYGTITLPPNLRLIERHAFASSVNVRDVYVLNETAPECHVDAFNSVLYHANNTVANDAIKEEDGVKIITRDAYTMSGYQMMAVLHYPRTTGTPQTQRYTDPSRDYNIATGERDGNGNMLYFPTQTEFETAHAQGTYGYLWGAWNTERTWYNNEKTLGTAGGWYGDICGTDGHDTSNGQGIANQFYTDNPDEDPDFVKANNTFYDVTMSDLNQPGGYTKPSDLKDYWTLQRRDYQLYPKAVSTTSNYVYVRDDNGNYVKEMTTTGSGESLTNALQFREYAGASDDEKNLERYSIKKVVQTDGQGNIVYVQDSNGNYVEDYEWVPDDGGQYVKVNELDGYASTNVLVDGVDTYYSDTNGTVATTLELGSGQYYGCGSDNDYSPIDINSEQPGARTVYYTTNDNGQTYQELTSLPLSGNPTLYYSTGETETKYTATDKLKNSVAHYFDGDKNEVYPALIPSNPANGIVYYIDNNNVERETTVFVPNQKYYVKTKNTWNDEYSYLGEVDDNYPSVALDGTYYYEDGTEEKYEQAQNYTPGTTYYTENNGNYSVATIQWYMISGSYYYVSGSHPTYCDTEGETYDPSTTYYSDANGTTEATTIHLNNTYYIPNYVEVYRAPEAGEEGLQHYSKNPLGTYRLATAADAGEQRWSPSMVNYVSDTEITYNKQNDYRGWHQFVLAAVAHNSKVPFEPLRSWISDNDWWTICEPYDLKYSDLIKFFGYDRQGFEKKIPYLSKLMYVIRDVENQKITLMFSKNLMEYKEQMGEGEGIVHGTISEQVKWSPSELADDPVILHAGVPYLIRPNLVAESGSFIRQFDIYKNQDPDLYQRLKDSQDISAGKQFRMIYNGEYTVPAFVVGYDATGAVQESTVATKTITNKDGSSFTYTSGGTIKYNGKNVNYKVSGDFQYTFVGTLYKSAMPQYCYFLGWDSEKNRATFWYSHVLDKDGWNWNNETGIICPNFDTSLQIHQASSMNDPARWVFNPDNKTDNVDDYVDCDDFPGGSGVAGAKQFTMDFGATNCSEYSEVNGISELIETPVNEELHIYNANGVYMGNSLKGLAKGIYIVNGKKYVVK